MANYRDIGSFQGFNAPLMEVDTTRYGQVYKATHEGTLRLPLMNRSFISFSYGGKWIEDFNLIATVSGDRMEREGYANFVDKTSEYDNLEGQQYWSTHYRALSLDIHLSTDGITQRELDEFLYWFRAGEAKELILAEHPNRAILARVANPPKLSMLPFREEVYLMSSNTKYSTYTTLFKGDISLTLVSDSPHWYSKMNVLGTLNGSHFEDKWINANGVKEEIFMSKDALKIIYEDGIPVGSMINTSMLLGDGTYATVGDDLESRIWNTASEVQSPNALNMTGGGACIDGGIYHGMIAGAIIDASGNGVESLPAGESAYFFYAGNAPAFTEIQFSLTPRVDSGSFYITSPRNKHSTLTLEHPYEYNTITIESRTQQKLVFTTPNIYTSYNKAIELFHKYIVANTYSWEDVRKYIRDEVRHAAVRAWAIQVVDTAARQSNWSNNGIVTSAVVQDQIAEAMSYMFRDKTTYELMPTTYTFNSETGEAIASFSYRTPSTNFPASMSVDDWLSHGTLIKKEEDVGDMLRSNHIIIRDRNYADAEGNIVSWSDTSETTKAYSHRITHDVEGTGLTNFCINYRYMYL